VLTSIELEIHNRSKRFKEQIARKAEELRLSKLAPVVIEATPEPQQEAEPKPDPVQEWVSRQLNSAEAIPFPKRSDFLNVQAACCHYFGILKSELIGRRRTAHLAYARQIGMYLLRKYYPHRSFPEIGRRFGGRDHTTALHSCQKIQALINIGHEKTIADVKAVEALLHTEPEA
jgi:chromosomal replication initiator protein